MVLTFVYEESEVSGLQINTLNVHKVSQKLWYLFEGGSMNTDQQMGQLHIITLRDQRASH